MRPLLLLLLQRSERVRERERERDMGQGLSCGTNHEQGLFRAVQFGEFETVKAVLEREPALLHHTTVYDRHSALHIAAANGQIKVGSFSFH